MAEVLEGRHTDEEIATADVMVTRDMSTDTPELTRKRILQHTLFVQVNGTTELMRYLTLHISVSPTDYAPSGIASRILRCTRVCMRACMHAHGLRCMRACMDGHMYAHIGARLLRWAKDQQHHVDLSMVSTTETTKDLPDIKVEGYEFLFTEHLHALNIDIAGQAGDRDRGLPKRGFLGGEAASKAQDEMDQTSKKGQAVAASFRVLLSLLRYGTDSTKKAVLEQIRDIGLLRSLICLADDVTDGRWYPANVGPNLLLIMQDLCLLDKTVLEADSKEVIIYDMITIMLTSAVAMLEPKLDYVIAQGKAVSSRLRPMGQQEELLMRNCVITCGIMCETITHMHFADAVEVNIACRELALQLLLPVSQMMLLIKYLYYENLLSYSVWSTEEVRGHVGMWACGHVGMWACGYVGMWACGYVGMCACRHVDM